MTIYVCYEYDYTAFNILLVTTDRDKAKAWLEGEHRDAAVVDVWRDDEHATAIWFNEKQYGEWPTESP